MSSSVQEKVFQIVAKEAKVDPAEVTIDSTLQSLRIESLAALEILFAIEDHFDISLPERDPDFATLRGLVTLVEAHVAQKKK